MIVISFLIGTISLIALLLSSYFWWARYKITNHPNVEPIHIAHPSIAEEMTNLVEHIAAIARTPSPKVFVFRSKLPNAFIVPSTRNPRLFLADELFEACNALGADAGLKHLERAICHEIAHLKRRDALPLGVIELISILGQRLRLKSFIHSSNNWRDSIERQTDNMAISLLQSLQAQLNKFKPPEQLSSTITPI